MQTQSENSEQRGIRRNQKIEGVRQLSEFFPCAMKSQEEAHRGSSAASLILFAFGIRLLRIHSGLLVHPQQPASLHLLLDGVFRHKTPQDQGGSRLADAVDAPKRLLLHVIGLLLR